MYLLSMKNYFKLGFIVVFIMKCFTLVKYPNMFIAFSVGITKLIDIIIQA
jgi:hypothetical protein